MKYEKREITAADAAAVLAVSERHAEALLKDRLIAGRQLRSGAWLTSRAAVERYRTTAQRGRGRALSAPTAWGMLWELSGLQATWLSTSTLARVRQQVTALSAEEIVQATSGRTRARYYAPSSTTPDVAWEGLIRTGRPAARHLGVRVNRAYNYAAGYVRDGTSAAFATRHAFVEDYEGMNVLFDNTLPIPYSRQSMPDAVVAVDLALTGGVYERERGAVIIARLQNTWREARLRS
ncbi:hypothetical protein [Microbacterium oxydans]|uniref:Helix-turn-helix domain-containing protein n=1 Tax=Microbacterium oxydans TaxID=82380 RepID=A0A0F0LG30_9MICO|nr:hypothetical protein [Microbacterium oxydans]KJL30501.1 hypothetical protein RS83_00887 [Microbacterium oxydans]